MLLVVISVVGVESVGGALPNVLIDAGVELSLARTVRLPAAETLG